MNVVSNDQSSRNIRRLSDVIFNVAIGMSGQFHGQVYMHDGIQLPFATYSLSSISLRLPYGLISPARLVITEIIVRKSQWAGSIDTHDIDFTTGCVLIGDIGISRICDPLAIG